MLELLMLEFRLKLEICLCSDDGRAEKNHGYINGREGSSAGRGGDRGGGSRGGGKGGGGKGC